MYSLTFIIVSAAKRGPWQELSQDYLKRLSPYAKCKVVAIPHMSFSSEAQREKVQAQEAGAIRRSISPGSFVIVCDEHGKTFTSTQFATQLTTWSEQETRNLTFILGGPLGLDPSLKKISNASLALSSFTLAHDLAAVTLLEQVYRSMTIITRKTYHY